MKRCNICGTRKLKIKLKTGTFLDRIVRIEEYYSSEGKPLCEKCWKDQDYA